MKNDKIFKIIALVFFLASLYLFCPVYSYADTIVVVVKSRAIGPYLEVVESFKKAMAGYDYRIETREFDFSGEAMPADLNAGIQAVNPALIFSLGTPATKALRQVFGGLPVVYAMVLNPGASNLGPPGVSMDIPFEIKLKELKKAMPEVKRIGIIYSADYEYVFNNILEAAGRLNLNLVGKKIASQKEFSDNLSELLGQIDCFLMITDPNIYLPKTTEYLLLEALQKKVPVIGLSSFYTKAGAIMAFDCDYADLGQQSAELIFKILANKGENAKEAVNPRKIKFSLNLKVAQRLGIDIPQEIIKEAGEVFGK